MGHFTTHHVSVLSNHDYILLIVIQAPVMDALVVLGQHFYRLL